MFGSDHQMTSLAWGNEGGEVPIGRASPLYSISVLVSFAAGIKIADAVLNHHISQTRSEVN